ARGGGDLNRTLEAMAALPSQGSPALQALAGERAHVAGLVDSFGRVAGALGGRAEAIRLLTRQAKTAAAAVAQRDASLRATLRALPSFLAQAGATSTRLRGFSQDATPVVRDLRAA